MEPTSQPTPLNPAWGPFGQALLDAGTVIFLLACVIELAFLVHYIIVAPAFKSWIGWMFVLRSSSFLFAGTAIVLGRIFGPDYAWRPYVTFGLFLVVFFSAVTTYGTFLGERYRWSKDRPDQPRGAARRRPTGPVRSFTRRAFSAKRYGTDSLEIEPEPGTTLHLVEDQKP